MSIAAPILIALIFSFAMYPMVNMDVKDMPVAIVSEDEGAVTPAQTINAADALLQQIEGLGGENGMLKITVMENKDKAIKKAKEGDFCAVIVIPADFTAKQMTMATENPAAPNLQFYINQGSYGMLATVMESAMQTTMIARMGETMRPQIAAAFAKEGFPISEEQLAYYDEPISLLKKYIFTE